MVEQVEISSLDLRYQGYRMRCPGAEKALLLSILETGIRDPLQGIDTQQCRILLDGFKRYRCAAKLGIGIVPYCSLSSDEATGIRQRCNQMRCRSLRNLRGAHCSEELQRHH